MPSQTRITLDRSGIGQLAKSESLRKDMLRRAERVAAAASQEASQLAPGGEVVATGIIGARRARASVMWVGGLAAETAHRLLGRCIDHARD